MTAHRRLLELVPPAPRPAAHYAILAAILAELREIRRSLEQARPPPAAHPAPRSSKLRAR